MVTQCRQPDKTVYIDGLLVTGPSDIVNDIVDAFLASILDGFDEDDFEEPINPADLDADLFPDECWELSDPC